MIRNNTENSLQTNPNMLQLTADGGGELRVGDVETGGNVYERKEENATKTRRKNMKFKSQRWHKMKLSRGKNYSKVCTPHQV